jgi:tight adherence protein C
MTPTSLLDLALLLCGTLFLAAAVIGPLLLAGAERRARRLEAAAWRAAGTVRAPVGTSALGRLGLWLSNSPAIGAQELARVRALLREAGIAAPGAAPLALAVKALLALGGPLAFPTALAQSGELVIALVAALAVTLIGWRLPDLALGVLRRRRREAIERGLPDALDLLVICGEAGVGLETALDRVATEMATAHPALGAELSIAAAEMRVLSDRYTALLNLADRVPLDSLRSVLTTLIQTLRYGTPLGQALRTIAAELRTLRIARFEEKAARLPVLITLPMVAFILPSVFVIVGGPAALDLYRTLSH